MTITRVKSLLLLRRVSLIRVALHNETYLHPLSVLKGVVEASGAEHYGAKRPLRD